MVPALRATVPQILMGFVPTPSGTFLLEVVYMSTLQEALQNIISPHHSPVVLQPVAKVVACKPTRPRDVRRSQEREQVTLSLEKFIDGLIEPLVKPRKIVISKAGDFYKARYEGRATSVFVYELKNAKKNLKFFGED
jgi:hypothetical protein